MVNIIYPGMQPVEQLSLLEVTNKLAELTKKFEEFTTIQTEPVKVVFASFDVACLSCKHIECRIFNVTKKLARVMSAHPYLFERSVFPDGLRIWSVGVNVQHLDPLDLKGFEKELSSKRKCIEDFFKEINVPCTIVNHNGTMESYHDQF